VRVRIATFNVENLGSRNGQTLAIETRRPTLQAQLKRLDADILCLQEVNAQAVNRKAPRVLRDLETVLGGTPYAAFHRVCTSRHSKVEPLSIHNLVTLSRWPIARHRQLWNDLVSMSQNRLQATIAAIGDPARIEWDRPALIAEIPVTAARTLHVVNLHLRAPVAAHIPNQKLATGAWKTVPAWAEGLFTATVKSNGQAFEVRMAIDEIFDQDTNALIAVVGDFNAEASETPVRILRGDPVDTCNTDLASRALAPLADMAGADAFTVVHGERRLMLDHVLVSRPLALACRKLTIDNIALLDDMESARVGALRPGSYHAPVVAEFDLC
jgi:endonuclease/exonuclease/phosphatase family metal-dependent hydrolase